jgi:hypothetical protein
MKNIILLSLFILCISCSKENEPTCVTCELKVHHTEYGSNSWDFIEQTQEYCDDSYKAIDGKTIQSGGGTSGGQQYSEVKTWHCK